MHRDLIFVFYVNWIAMGFNIIGMMSNMDAAHSWYFYFHACLAYISAGFAYLTLRMLGNKDG